jgi:hypothetical protein
MSTDAILATMGVIPGRIAPPATVVDAQGRRASISRFAHANSVANGLIGICAHMAGEREQEQREGGWRTTCAGQARDHVQCPSHVKVPVPHPRQARRGDARHVLAYQLSIGGGRLSQPLRSGPVHGFALCLGFLLPGGLGLLNHLPSTIPHPHPLPPPPAPCLLQSALDRPACSRHVLALSVCNQAFLLRHPQPLVIPPGLFWAAKPAPPLSEG